MKIEWLDEPEEHDFPAAESYLMLHFDSDYAEELVNDLRDAPMSKFKAKDIARASGIHMLGLSNSHVEKNRDKIKKGERLSPILLVRHRDNLIIADGFHRVSAVYQLDEDAWIPCKIV